MSFDNRRAMDGGVGAGGPDVPGSPNEPAPVLEGADGHRRIAVAIGAATTLEAKRRLVEAASVSGADLAELRLDYLEDYRPGHTLRELLADRSLPVIVTNRPLREGGRSAGDEPARLRALREAVDLGAELVDVEQDAVGDYEDLPAGSGRLGGRPAIATRLIVSSHDFSAMPTDFAARRERIVASGADIAKVVGTARRLADCAVVLDVLGAATTPTIAIAMGAAGLASRVLATRSDACFLTFGTLAGDAGTAPGQISARMLRDVYLVNRLRPTTLAYGILSAEPVADELVSELNGTTRASGRDAVWLPLLAAAGPAEAAGALAAFRRHNFAGYLVDEAIGREVIGSLDEVDLPPGSRDVNVIWRSDGRLIGGWIAGLSARVDQAGDGR